MPELPPAPKPDAVLVPPPKPAQPPPKVKTELRPDRLEEIEKDRLEKQQLLSRKIEKEKIAEERAETEPREARGQGAGRARRADSAAVGGPRVRRGEPPRRRGARRSTDVSASAWQARFRRGSNSNKRYPSSAKGASGAATISFAIDRSGRLVSARLVGSSGSPALDAEAVAIVRRSSPFPPPPAGVAGGHFSKPVNFRRCSDRVDGDGPQGDTKRKQDGASKCI